MFSFKKSLAAFVGLLALVGILVAVVPFVSHGQGSRNGPPPFDVTVINSPSEPVPVTGTVNVANLGGSTLPVHDVDNPARQPLQVDIIRVPFPIPNPILFTVPDGKRLVIEYVSADIQAVNAACTTSPRFALTTTAGGTTLAHFFYPENTGTLSDGNRAFGLSRQTRIYADPNTDVTLDIRTGTTPN